MLLKVCYVPATSSVLIALFTSFLLRPLTVLMKQTRQPVHAIKQSIYIDVYGQYSHCRCPCQFRVRFIGKFRQCKRPLSDEYKKNVFQH